ncbi:MAG: cell division protein FtsZ [Eubacteriales bacterium]|jgi:cell division protein FtsZ
MPGFEFESTTDTVVNIKVVGVGGGGCNAVERMLASGLKGVDFITINTDKKQLINSASPHKLQIGEKLTRGFGAGSNPDIGKKAAEETRSELTKVLESADMVFITAGMGGGTGTGAAPIVAEVARERDILTIGVVTRPFDFEGAKRYNQAEKGIQEMRSKVDALVVIPNDRLKLVSEQRITFKNAFEIADNVLLQAIQSISDLITMDGIINLDFADVTSIMKGAGYAHMGVGYGTGRDKAEAAARQAIQSPLLETSITGARGVIINITGCPEITLEEVENAAMMVKQAAHETAHIIFGASIDDTMEDAIRVTVIATQFDDKPGLPENVPAAAQPAAEKPAEAPAVKSPSPSIFAVPGQPAPDPVPETPPVQDADNDDDIYSDIKKIFDLGERRRG